MIIRKCCICGRLVEGKAYSAEPYKKGICCAKCNHDVVYPAKQNLSAKGKYIKNFR